MLVNEPDPLAGRPVPENSGDAAAPEKARGGRLVRLGEAILDALRDLTHVLAALRSLIAGDYSDGMSLGRHEPAAKVKARGERIRRAREAQKLTRVALAKKIGANQQTIEKIERGLIRHSSIMPQLFAALGLEPDKAAAGATMPAWPAAAGPSIRGTPDIPIDGADTEMRHNPMQTRLDTDYEFFAAQKLRIRPKSGGAVVPLVFHRVQRYVQEQIEEQRAKTGKVRAIILKGRQQGCSSYVGGRFYHRVTHTRGQQCYILTHEEQATQTLFNLVDVFLKHDDDPPSTSVANANELYFDELDSGYKVGTAGTKGVGRSSTLQLFHGSEVALWPHAQTHAAGVMQAVPDLPGTEIILESTAQGVGNLFHKLWRDAETGASDYLAIFVPWYWQEEYRKAVGDPRSEPGAGFKLDQEETEYAALYGLGAEQMAWRRARIVELNDPALFKQEYPATAAEAFQMSGHDSFIPPALVEKARKARCEASGPLIIGYDPAWTGGDRHAMAWRRGRQVIKVETRRKLDTVQATGWARQVIDNDKPAKLFIDVGAMGPGIFDPLKHLGPPYSTIVEGVSFGSAPFEPPPLDENGRPSGGPLNRRAEIWGKSKQWLEEPAGVQIPDSDSLQADCCGPAYHYDSLGRLALESKDDMLRRKVPSPDEGDAVALTFAPSNFHRKLVYPPSGWR